MFIDEHLMPRRGRVRGSWGGECIVSRVQETFVQCIVVCYILHCRSLFPYMYISSIILRMMCVSVNASAVPFCTMHASPLHVHPRHATVEKRGRSKVHEMSGLLNKSMGANILCPNLLLSRKVVGAIS